MNDQAAHSGRLVGSASTGLRGIIQVPGDKSMSHRALLFGAMAEGETKITGLLEGEDVLRMATAVEALGAKVRRTGDGSWRVEGGPWHSADAPLDCGNSGTAARLLMGAVAGMAIEARFTGDRSLSSRPMRRVLAPLEAMGARLVDGDSDRLPLTVKGGSLNGISYRNEAASAQIKSAILLAGLHAQGEVEVIEPRPSRDHSENMLRSFGCDVESMDRHGERFIRLGERRHLKASDVEIAGDPSSAAFPLVAALITPNSEVTVRNVLLNPLRTGLFATLEEMGADIVVANRRVRDGEWVGDVTARTSRLKSVEVPAQRAPSMIDEYPILGIAAAFAHGRSIMHGLAELRVKESDRLAAIVAGLTACGVAARSEEDSLVVEGQGTAPAGGCDVTTHGDHRLAMSFLVMGQASGAPVTVDEAEMIATSFPGFADLMHSLGARIEAGA
ncbi:3-phosphoshikimate 1-carboxyvinyltransferase [Sphingosinicella rhizophila]|uniref:3-phosphoshikimate 1-carboxyvinyltransferase n=1 Tax=Sphingosinicella rhizophila TaxID=3050082 RepID=A0ABU3Q966_9SPHN|nr:3-phosphoshikimate 1-carboxyvinyltransferase [Sphingosinicella sp. GR2756]MDT9599943.1 3-phosphoshikimate 1-carboxyvinyltransferase [Sphingosinicella sp. GR2756]